MNYRSPSFPLARSGGLLEAWYRFDTGVTLDSAGRVQQVDDQSGRGRHISQSNAALRLYASRRDNKGNLMKWSEDIQSNTGNGWQTSGITKLSASTFLPTTDTGHLHLNIAFADPLKKYTLSFRAARVAGTSDVTFWTNGSASGNTQPLVITGTMTRYSVTVAGPAVAGNLDLGFANNRSGIQVSGILQIDNFSVVESAWDSDFLTTSGAQMYLPARLGKGTIFMDRELGAGGFNLTAAGFPLTQPCTVYMLCLPFSWNSGIYYWDGASVNLGGVAQTTSSPKISVRPDAVPIMDSLIGRPHIVTAVYDGTSSVIQVNRDSVTGGTTGGNLNGFCLNGRPDGSRTSPMEIGEVIIRKGADDAQTRSDHIRYLADQWKLVL